MLARVQPWHAGVLVAIALLAAGSVMWRQYQLQQRAAQIPAPVTAAPAAPAAPR